MFAPGRLRWTTVGILSGICAGTAYFPLPKALNNQGFAVSASLGLTSIVYAASFVGKGFAGFLREVIRRLAPIPRPQGGRLNPESEGPGIVLRQLLPSPVDPYAHGGDDHGHEQREEPADLVHRHPALTQCDLDRRCFTLVGRFSSSGPLSITISLSA